MDNLVLMKELSRQSATKIVMMVIDGLGGLPNPETGKTELEAARTPNLDALATAGICGLADPVAPGITPGSAPGHLALFGYDPISCLIGRGVLEAIGIDIELKPGDVAVRGNFCTIDKEGLVIDRRAGRISTEKCTKLCELLNGISIDADKVSVHPVREHRFVVIFHGEYSSDAVSETDPQQVGVSPLTVEAVDSKAEGLADIANRFITQAKTLLVNHHPANMILLRGFSKQPGLPTMKEIYKLNPLAIAVYPMYRGLARLVGMEIARTRATLEDEFATLKQNYMSHDFFFLHIKQTDSAGEDGDFGRKVEILEQIDSVLHNVVNMEPDVLIITGDHSTPAVLKGHSWHPVPVLLYSKYCRPDNVEKFQESAFISGGLGRIQATDIMPLAMANALKLTKFGA